ncbi:hypothetical protein K503DRAFT_765719 [Rhizopogon vinicolor AM-OR11-026]|uniref:Uncharacterized protein n=1 Tax=Rhizopogon vinicolor AM-OR11-026 TaxID=1314800 RepID=A0A1B7NFL2_9AGAM|nr:hypothetical protein K503DRAFT_765719 [Rhizopogon vinicolor AM-OR11-026]
MFRKAITPNARIFSASYTRSIHVTPAAGTVTEKVSEMAEKVNKKVGRGLASAIETGEKAAEKTKGTLGTTSASAGQKSEEKTKQAKRFTQETAEQAKQKGNQAAASARETKDDVKSRMSK